MSKKYIIKIDVTELIEDLDGSIPEDLTIDDILYCLKKTGETLIIGGTKHQELSFLWAAARELKETKEAGDE